MSRCSPTWQGKDWKGRRKKAMGRMGEMGGAGEKEFGGWRCRGRGRKGKGGGCV